METQLLDVLKRSRIKARGYHRAPFGEDVFALTVNRKGEILVHQGKAKVVAHGSRKHRQAVATIEEGNRVITRHITTDIRSPDHDPLRVNVVRRLKEHFGVAMPKETKWSVREVKVTRRMMNDPTDGRSKVPTAWCDITGKVTATVRSTTINHLLMGVDESRNFISPLPKPATSVLEAHKMLRPKSVPVKAIRQGEWFFVPITNKQRTNINEYVKYHPDQVRQLRLGGGTHKALSTVGLGRKIYARGYVIDPRQGHHKALYLPKWHQVIKNQEAELNISPAQKAAAERYRRTWD